MDAGDLFKLLILLIVCGIVAYALFAVFLPALSQVQSRASAVGEGVGGAVNVIQSMKNFSNFTAGAFPVVP
ncbi:MAG: hypothetical protein ACP5IG_00165 [Candidatus Micrarchaeia archaeon]